MNNDRNYLKLTAINKMADTNLCRGGIHQLRGKEGG